MNGPGEFFDPVAQLYDAHVASDDDESLPDDTVFYRELAREADGPVLELGVGTGRIYLELLDDDIDADGIDLSQAMLDQLHENADSRNLDPSVRVADITNFDPDRKYDLIYAPNRVFNHLPTLADQRAALLNIRDALASNGQFALNTFVPRFKTVVENYGEPQEDQMIVNDDSYRLVMTSYLSDEVEQVAHLHQEVYRGEELVAERKTPLALIPKRQFELLFELTEFNDWQAYGGFDRNRLESSDQEMVWVVDA
ncbi:class I SAM-dependent methyltransferase [Halosolutus halophilus]|uniref:methyltransferase domain-containing protein n=1 Tax=Halosolutus halophilus TaxID=1552990 RepID=UPI0022350E39|nr:class I SAM-dependent methyltransferase [Halosolutus halophilus]